MKNDVVASDRVRVREEGAIYFVVVLVCVLLCWDLRNYREVCRF